MRTDANGMLCCGVCGDTLVSPAVVLGAVSKCGCGKSSVSRTDPDDLLRPVITLALGGTEAATALLRDAQRSANLDDLDPQSRERLIRAAEDSVRGELRRVNEKLCEALAENERLRSGACSGACARAVRAESEAEALKVGIMQLRARLAEESARPPAPSTGPCAMCAVPTEARVLTSDGALCVRCWTQRGAAAE